MAAPSFNINPGLLNQLANPVSPGQAIIQGISDARTNQFNQQKLDMAQDEHELRLQEYKRKISEEVRERKEKETAKAKVSETFEKVKEDLPEGARNAAEVAMANGDYEEVSKIINDNAKGAYKSDAAKAGEKKTAELEAERAFKTLYPDEEDKPEFLTYINKETKERVDIRVGDAGWSEEDVELRKGGFNVYKMSTAPNEQRARRTTGTQQKAAEAYVAKDERFKVLDRKDRDLAALAVAQTANRLMEDGEDEDVAFQTALDEVATRVSAGDPWWKFWGDDAALEPVGDSEPLDLGELEVTTYESADAVVKAYKDGNITYDEAAEILKRDFDATD